MGILNRSKNYKKCPYCKTKNPIATRYCMACHLDFYQLDKCKNSEAKKMLRHRRFGETFEGEIVNVKELPSDVSRVKLIIFCLFLGLFGGHNFYVGRYFKAILQCILGIAFLGVAIALSVLMDMPSRIVTFFGVRTTLVDLITFLTPLVGMFPAFTWLFDFFAIIFKKYEVPIALEIPVDIPEED